MKNMEFYHDVLTLLLKITLITSLTSEVLPLPLPHKLILHIFELMVSTSTAA
jgi:hypothetical protein